MLTFEEFQDSRETMTPNEVETRFNLYADYFRDDIVHVYADLFLTENRSGEFWTILARDEFVSEDRAELERRLYVDWYASECTSDYTTNQLAGLLRQFAILYNLELASADEMLFDLTKDAPEQRTAQQHRAINWLQWFCDTWEDTQRKEDNAAFGNRA